jgi:hypothetical protein
MYAHLDKTALKVHTYKNFWIKKLLKLGLKPIFKIIWTGSIKKVNQKERYYIKYYNKKFKLTNGTTGGDGWPVNFPMTGKHKKGKEQFHQRKPVIIRNLKTEKEIKFDSIKSASKYFNIHMTTIIDVLKKRNGSFYGNHARYANEEFIPFKYKLRKPVIAFNILNNDVKYYDYPYLAKKDGFNNRCISYCLKGQRIHHRGYIWLHA